MVSYSQGGSSSLAIKVDGGAYMGKKLVVRFLCLYLAGLLCLPAVSAAERAEQFSGGAGTPEAPYLLDAPEQLVLLAELVNRGEADYRSAHYRLTADLDMKSAEGFRPIGDSPEHSFQGVFDGGGHIIYGLEYRDEALREEVYREYHLSRAPAPVYGGLFGVLEGGTVTGLTLTGSVGGTVAGGLVGWNRGGTVSSCASFCTPLVWSVIKDSLGGGIAALNEGRVENCCYGGAGGFDVVGSNGSEGTAVNSMTAGTDGGVMSSLTGRCTGDAVCWGPDGAVEEIFPVEDIRASVQDGTGLWEEACNRWAQSLNAWAAGQGSSYARWRAVEDWFPLPADHLITVEIETGDYLPASTLEGFSPIEAYGGSLLSLFPGRTAGTEDRLVLPARDGVSRTLFFAPADGYRLADVQINGVSVGAESSYTIPAVTEDLTVLLRFVKSGSMSHFTLQNEYMGFADVEESAWYGTEQEGVLRDAVELGLFHGVGGDRFSPDRALTLAETVKLAAVVRSTYCGDGHRFDQAAGTHWYDTYLDYAVAQGILTREQFPELDRTATRSEAAFLLFHALPETELPQRSTLSPPDVTLEAPYYYEISRLYQAGVLSGSDGNGTFHGGSTLTRAQAAAIAVRLVLPERRAADR